jgi:hypothetical protein
MGISSIMYSAVASEGNSSVFAADRTEIKTIIRYKGNVYTKVVRDKTVIEDSYLVLVKAAAYAIQTSTPYQGRIVPRSIRDFLIKNNVESA